MAADKRNTNKPAGSDRAGGAAQKTPAQQAPPAGDDRQHTVRDKDGNWRRMSDDEWIGRDPDAGLVRVDDDGNELAEGEVNTEREPGVKTTSDLDD